MSDPFESSRGKIAWAKKNLDDLKRETTAFFEQENFYEGFFEPHPDKPNYRLQKLRITRQLPDTWPHIVGSIVDSLRAALDHAIYDIAVAAGCNKPVHAQFPFSKDADRFEANLKGRCADVPKQIYPLFRRLQPYKGGNDPLWALNRIRVTNNHIPLEPIGTATFVTGVDVTATGFWSMPVTPIWDRAKNEMTLFTLGPNVKFKSKVDISFYVAFGEIELLEGKNAIPVLDEFIDMVETILGEIEAETRRLGII
jgi:hypothetical protein